MAIDTIYVQQYTDNLLFAAQQLVSKFYDRVEVKEGVKGEATYFDLISIGTAGVKSNLHEDHTLTDPSVARVKCSLQWIYEAIPLDPDSEGAILADPKGKFVRLTIAAINKKLDDLIINAALGTRYIGKDGTTADPLPSSQIIASGSAGLTVAKLREARQKLLSADVDPEEPMFCAITPKQLDDLLATTEVTSADYNTVRALVNGQIDTFLGFKFVISNRLTTNGLGERQVICWAKSGLGLAVGNKVVRVGERPDKHYLWQSYFGMLTGAVRIENEKVVEIDCVE